LFLFFSTNDSVLKYPIAAKAMNSNAGIVNATPRKGKALGSQQPPHNGKQQADTQTLAAMIQKAESKTTSMCASQIIWFFAQRRHFCPRAAGRCLFDMQ
jgi:hypothetical protein